MSCMSVTQLSAAPELLLLPGNKNTWMDVCCYLLPEKIHDSLDLNHAVL